MRPATPLLALAASAAALLGPAVGAAASAVAPGTPDPSFGTNGFLHTHDIVGGLGEDGTSFDRLRLLADGGMAATGVERCGMDCEHGVVARYTAAGSFVARSVYTITDEYGSESSPGGLVRPDGGLVVGVADSGEDHGGGAHAPRSYLRIIEPDGATREVDVPLTLWPQSPAPDGGLVALSDHLLVRLGPGLAQDPVFGAGGTAAVPPLLATVTAAAAARSTIRVSGFDPGGLSLARFDPGGRLQSAARIPVPGASLPTGVVGARLLVRRDGYAFVVGRAWARRPVRGEITPTVIGAFLPDGRVDRSFGRSGLLRVAQSDAAIAFQRDGRIVVAAGADSRTSSDHGARLILRRLTATGRPDPSFPTRSFRTRAGEFYGLDVAVDRRDRIVVAAGAFAGYGSSSLMFARFLPGGRAPAAG